MSFSYNLTQKFRYGADLSLQGRTLLPSESYICLLRYLKIEHNMPPWEWDEDYPDDMYGKYYPEDIMALVQIDLLIHEREQENKK